MTEKLRIRISQIFAGLLVVLICISSSLWEDKAPFVTTVLFLLGAFHVQEPTLFFQPSGCSWRWAHF